MINAEGGEYVVRKSAYAKHADLVRAINEDNLPKLNAEVLNNTTIDKNGDVVINNEIWNKMYDLWDKNLNGDRVEISNGKKIITRGSKKRIVNV
jgi:hypothetical protein